jgi:hypothetical protein
LPCQSLSQGRGQEVEFPPDFEGNVKCFDMVGKIALTIQADVQNSKTFGGNYVMDGTSLSPFSLSKRLTPWGKISINDYLVKI